MIFSDNWELQINVGSFASVIHSLLNQYSATWCSHGRYMEHANNLQRSWLQVHYAFGIGNGPKGDVGDEEAA